MLTQTPCILEQHQSCSQASKLQSSIVSMEPCSQALQPSKVADKTPLDVQYVKERIAMTDYSCKSYGRTVEQLLQRASRACAHSKSLKGTCMPTSPFEVAVLQEANHCVRQELENVNEKLQEIRSWADQASCSTNGTWQALQCLALGRFDEGSGASGASGVAGGKDAADDVVEKDDSDLSCRVRTPILQMKIQLHQQRRHGRQELRRMSRPQLPPIQQRGS